MEKIKKFSITILILFVVYFSFIHLTTYKTGKIVSIDLSRIHLTIKESETHSKIVMSDSTVYTSNNFTINFIKEVTNYHKIGENKEVLEMIISNGFPLIELNSYFGSFWVVDLDKIKQWKNDKKNKTTSKEI